MVSPNHRMTRRKKRTNERASPDNHHLHHLLGASLNEQPNQWAMYYLHIARLLASHTTYIADALQPRTIASIARLYWCAATHKSAYRMHACMHILRVRMYNRIIGVERPTTRSRQMEDSCSFCLKERLEHCPTIRRSLVLMYYIMKNYAWALGRMYRIEWRGRLTCFISIIIIWKIQHHRVEQLMWEDRRRYKV